MKCHVRHSKVTELFCMILFLLSVLINHFIGASNFVPIRIITIYMYTIFVVFSRLNELYRDHSHFAADLERDEANVENIRDLPSPHPNAVGLIGMSDIIQSLFQLFQSGALFS